MISQGSWPELYIFHYYNERVKFDITGEWILKKWDREQELMSEKLHIGLPGEYIYPKCVNVNKNI